MHRRAARIPILAGLTSIGVLTLLAACTTAPRAPPVPSEFDDAGFRHEVRTLTSERFGGRRPGTAGGQTTIDYLVAQFRRFGLKPGNGDSYTQAVPLVEISAGAESRLSISVSGEAPLRFAYGRDMLVWTRRETGTGSLAGSPVVFVGFGIDAPALHRDDYAGADVRGRTVLVLGGLPDAGDEAGVGRAPAPKGLARFGLASTKIEEAARHGAAGVLLVHAAGDAAEPWPAILARFGAGTIEAPAADGHAGAPAVEGWLREAAARRLFAATGLDFDAAVAGAARKDFRARPLRAVADAHVQGRVRQFESANVIAWLPGRRHRGEYVLYSAHWDHLGRVDGDGALLPGAVGNASGVAGLLLLAQRFARTEPRPDRSLVFLATTAGEYGALGSRYYVGHPRFPLRDTVADIDLEMLHIGGPTRDVSSLALGESQLDRYLAGAADIQGRVVRGDPAPQLARYLRSDAQVFAAHGVPALDAVGGIDDAAMGPQWGAARLREYFAKRYRQPGDRYSEEWDVRGTIEDLRLYFDVGMRLASTRRFPQWNAGGAGPGGG